MQKEYFEKLNSSIKSLQSKHFEFEKLKKQKLKIKDMILGKEIELKNSNRKLVLINC